MVGNIESVFFFCHIFNNRNTLNAIQVGGNKRCGKVKRVGLQNNLIQNIYIGPFRLLITNIETLVNENDHIDHPFEKT